jgi:hypothetical protein
MKVYFIYDRNFGNFVPEVFVNRKKAEHKLRSFPLYTPKHYDRYNWEIIELEVIK